MLFDFSIAKCLYISKRLRCYRHSPSQVEAYLTPRTEFSGDGHASFLRRRLYFHAALRWRASHATRGYHAAEHVITTLLA